MRVRDIPWHRELHEQMLRQRLFDSFGQYFPMLLRLRHAFVEVCMKRELTTDDKGSDEVRNTVHTVVRTYLHLRGACGI